MNKVLLTILDGYGIAKDDKGNAVNLASKGTIDELAKIAGVKCANASGTFVGLPDGQMGNSEVGHLNIGAGRVIFQKLAKISKDIKDGIFFENDVLLKAMNNVKDNNSNLHLMGLVSDGGVHSHIDHLLALVKMAAQNDVKNVYIHIFLDGRDTNPKAGLDAVKTLIDTMEKEGVGQIASVSGRYFAMDRDQRWERVKQAYDVTVEDADKLDPSYIITDPVAYIKASYENGITDEFVQPKKVVQTPGIHSKDSVIFFNFRPDRARQLTRAITEGIEGEITFNKVDDIFFVCMAEYDATLTKVHVAYPNVDITNTLGEVIKNENLNQLRIAETEKYAHVTFFFNGGKEDVFENEDRILVNSPKVATYDMQPEMSANIVSEKLVEAIDKDKYSLIVCNFANPDMVGHTANIKSTIEAVEAVDKCMSDIKKVVDKHNYTWLICADHGNAEKLIDDNGDPHTAHTTNLVPIILYNKDVFYDVKDNGSLCDIAPTILDVMGIKQPEEMTGHSLILDRKERK